jgi:hypothetical protein
MASISCAVCCSFSSADELAPADTLRVLRLHRLRRAAAGCLDPIAEEDDDSDVDDVPAARSPSTYTINSSSASLDRR